MMRRLPGLLTASVDQRSRYPHPWEGNWQLSICSLFERPYNCANRNARSADSSCGFCSEHKGDLPNDPAQTRRSRCRMQCRFKCH